jgi:hypothetical protein
MHYLWPNVNWTAIFNNLDFGSAIGWRVDDGAGGMEQVVGTQTPAKNSAIWRWSSAVPSLLILFARQEQIKTLSRT